MPARRTAAGTRAVRTAVYLLVVLTVGVYLPSPLYPIYQHAFGFGDLRMTLIYAMFALVSAPTLLVLGSASDAVGPRPVLRISVLLAALGTCCFAFAQAELWLLIGRAAQGLALGMATGAATAVITEHLPVRHRLPASVLASAAFVGGTAVGPMAAGVLAQYAPAPQMFPYLVHLALLGLGAWRVRALPGTRERGRFRPTRPRIPAGIRLLFTTAAATGFLAWTVAGLFLAVIPTVLGRTTQITNLALVGGIVGGVLTCSVLTQLLVSRCGAWWAQLAGLCALAISLLALALTGGGSVAVTMLSAVTAGVGHGLAYGGATAAVDPVAPAGQRAGINSALYLAFYLGSAVPAVLVGLLTLWYSLSMAIAWISAPAAALVPFVVAGVVGTARTRRSTVARRTHPAASSAPRSPTPASGSTNWSENQPSRPVWRKTSKSGPRSATVDGSGLLDNRFRDRRPGCTERR